jgi:hypothetical protein
MREITGTFCYTLPGEIENNDGCSIEHCREERAIDLGVGTITDRAREKEVCEL